MISTAPIQSSKSMPDPNGLCDGSLVDDVVIRESERVVNVGNTPSPAATASLNISKLIVGRLAARLT